MKIDYTIKEPIWKTRSIGLAEFRMGGKEIIHVKIAYRTKDGRELFPNPYVVTRKQLLNAPSQRMGGVNLRIIPIADLEEIK